VAPPRSAVAPLLALLLLACSRQAPPPAPDAGTPDAGIPDGGAPPAVEDGGDAGAGAVPDASVPDGGVGDGGLADGGAAAGAAALPVTAALAVLPAAEIPLAPGEQSLVDPGAAFRVEVAAQLTDARLSLRDGSDAMVPSSGTSEVGASWTRLRLTPESPLTPGSAYSLHLDGATTRDLHDPTGRAYAPAVYPLKTSGERPTAAKKRRRP
jgi:hypothetical protein